MQILVKICPESRGYTLAWQRSSAVSGDVGQDSQERFFSFSAIRWQGVIDRVEELGKKKLMNLSV